MRCQYYQRVGKKSLRCEDKATKVVRMRGEELGKVCTKHAASLVGNHPRTLVAEPLRQSKAA